MRVQPPLQRMPTVEERRRQEARVASVVHSLVPDCAPDHCRILNAEIFREVLTMTTSDDNEDDESAARITADVEILT